MATRLQIVTRAAVRADQDASDFVTAAQRNDIVDECARTVFYDLVAAGWPTDYTSTTVTANGSASYALNSGNPIHSVRAVFAQVGGEYVMLRRVDQSQLGARLSASAGGNVYPEYDVVNSMSSGPVLRLYPQSSTGSYLVHHIPEWAGFSGDSDVWRGPARSDELIVLMAAAKFLRKEGETQDAAALDQEYASLWDRVVSQASHFNARGGQRIQDVGPGAAGRDPFDYFAVGPDRGW